MDKKLLGKRDKGSQPEKQVWLLKLKVVRILGGEGVGQRGHEEDGSGKKDK